MYVAPLDGTFSPNSLASPAGNPEAEGALFQGAAAPAGDNITRFVPPWQNDSDASQYGNGYENSSSLQGMLGPLMGILQQLMQMLQSLMGYGCSGQSCPPYGGTQPPPYGTGNGTCSPYGNERYFQNASGASEGDPYLSFNGARWNNMASQPDLLNSNSFAGGFRISTQTSPQNAKGVSWNQSATVSMNNGATTISMTDNGQASITSDGQARSISRGQTLQLGNGESVTYEENGSLRVSAQNEAGGRIETTLSPEGKGVNVDVTAHDVDLGGALVNGYEHRPRNFEPVPQPSSSPVPMPNPTPVPDPIGVPISENEPQPVY
jgi:hypothetical protein